MYTIVHSCTTLKIENLRSISYEEHILINFNTSYIIHLCIFFISIVGIIINSVEKRAYKKGSDGLEDDADHIREMHEE